MTTLAQDHHPAIMIVLLCMKMIQFESTKNLSFINNVFCNKIFVDQIKAHLHLGGWAYWCSLYNSNEQKNEINDVKISHWQMLSTNLPGGENSHNFLWILGVVRINYRVTQLRICTITASFIYERYVDWYRLLSGAGSESFLFCIVLL